MNRPKQSREKSRRFALAFARPKQAQQFIREEKESDRCGEMTKNVGEMKNRRSESKGAIFERVSQTLNWSIKIRGRCVGKRGNAEILPELGASCE